MSIKFSRVPRRPRSEGRHKIWLIAESLKMIDEQKALKTLLIAANGTDRDVLELR